MNIQQQLKLSAGVLTKTGFLPQVVARLIAILDFGILTRCNLSMQLTLDLKYAT